ncbi:tRNA nucleotidyl transferase/2'3'-cyclic phosphodiesterase/2'-nucleotidase/phosphatase [Wigglesworthia glossinidia endosymbiont of Glossina morsitans morsitans (Yale colony)]|uniref:CCA-adding enzyme n=1 Tax=Wigglesworthia glossinidia endosymbiont of Glossina morsitans morsitans (Yale colony) TaxID=1142511 RepID=H6Q579_WIGGL|nr:CCA-adding protein [Wigglesworthia glossinidia]AFA41362.1 tRNA nucleotidyl transferase/2'3'-cyclic phosphodiesterase/2'-nucleotidase/phosphatase [Wigglesworthia glossinidia endosymbiont of Glossina morsitans morsitans (Yale colony)]
MKKYLVGGAVRDSLLNIPIKEKDWVVVGSSPEEMINLGFLPVGKSFPVFLHPKNYEEHALARTECKHGSGHTGFFFQTSPKITLKQDLKRRDLTVNAIAKDEKGNLIDPYGGLNDLKLRCLRHISNAFQEDPLRVLRVARFAAYLAHLNFFIASETLKKMSDMIHELSDLSVERIWLETKKALLSYNPQIYFKVLLQCGALNKIFPEISYLFQNSNSVKPPIRKDLGQKTLSALSIIVCLSDDIAVRFATLCYNFGKLNQNNLKNNIKKNKTKHSSILLNSMFSRLKLPRKILILSKIFICYHNILKKIFFMNPKKIILFLNHIDVWRKPHRINEIIAINKAHLCNLGNFKYHLYAPEMLLKKIYKLASTIKVENIIQDGFIGFKIKNELTERRKKIIEKEIFNVKIFKKNNFL